MEDLILVVKIIITSIYMTTLVVLSAFGLHRHYLANLFNKYKKRTPKPRGKFQRLPRVTVQLPIYNEMYVVERLISSVCAIDYPKELLEIQVLDDSTDQTEEIASNLVDSYKSLGFNINFIHRQNRSGFKAGALNEGLKLAQGKLIAIFDADFIPPKDFLRKTVDFFTDPQVGMVQVRWGHVNLDYSLLTKAQSILLDGHFVIEQASRFHTGAFFNFNGTAGILRKSCIESSGGWQHDTLTEDLDLSYRAQLKGWKFVYLKEWAVDAELPVDMNGFKSQQHRWAKGAIQTARKILPAILRSKELPLRIKFEATVHLLGNFAYVFILILLALILPMSYFWSSFGWEKVVLFNMFILFACTLSVVRFYAIAVREIHGGQWIRYLKYIPIAVALGTGIAINNSKAVFEALLGKQSEFRRTPKFAVTSRNDNWRIRSYTSSKELTSVIELLVGVFFMFQTCYAAYAGYIGSIPFLLLIQFGFIYTGLLSIIHGSHRETAKVDSFDAKRILHNKPGF